MSRQNLLIGLCLAIAAPTVAMADQINFTLRYQQETAPDSGRYHRLTKTEAWDPAKTAVIVCDVWDLHHCLNAVRRVEEFGPRLNEVIAEARKRFRPLRIVVVTAPPEVLAARLAERGREDASDIAARRARAAYATQGMTVIHSPSDCMAFYDDHPARRRAIEAPKAGNHPPEITSWCSKIPSEEKGVYPIDQSDGGEDDDPEEHAAWAEKLKAMGRNPGRPWQRQAELITIDPQRDFISDKGDEVWNVLESRGIENVILTGVHTNMCVLGRPFGLRQMARNGKHVVLMRDMTDTMYNPQRWPYVSHFTGTDLIVSHIEKFVCPTISSDQMIGGEEFRFAKDTRPHLAIVMAEREYQTNESLPEFAGKYLGKWFCVSYVFEDADDPNHLPGLSVLNDADAALFSVRRRTLKPEQLALVRKFVAAGKPVVGIRTASHAFTLRNQEPPAGYAAWPEFDAEVFGGNYSNHYGNKLKTTVTLADADKQHAILRGVPIQAWPSSGSLYKASPLKSGTTVLLTGSVEGQQPEPVAWTFTRENGGRSFYTSLGHVDDFQRPEFIRLLVNAICWAAEVPDPDNVPIVTDEKALGAHWHPVEVPGSWEAATAGALRGYDGPAWYRCAVRLPETWIAGNDVRLPVATDAQLKAWWNGHRLELAAAGFLIDADTIEPDDANLLVVRFPKGTTAQGFQSAPLIQAGERSLSLKGTWQFRVGDDPSWSSIPLPAKFGASADVVFQP